MTAASSSLSRRTAVRLGAGGLAASLATRSLRPSVAQEAPATFVLVHGAWAGAWIWRDVIPVLRAAGHDVYATTATGMGDRVHLADPAITLDTYVTDVVNLLEFEDLRDVILVGHSFGGMIISGVAEQVPERLAQLVYLDAAVPADGQSAFHTVTFSEEGRQEAIGAAIAVGEAAGVPGFVPVEFAEEWLRSVTPDPAVQEWIFAHFTPQPLATWDQPIQLGNPAAAAVPHVFINCTEGKGDAQTDFNVRTAEMVRADPDWTFLELAETHMAPVNDPQATAEVLLSLV